MASKTPTALLIEIRKLLNEAAIEDELKEKLADLIGELYRETYDKGRADEATAWHRGGGWGQNPYGN